MVAKEDALAADQATYIKHLNDLTASLNEIQAKLTPTVAKFQSKELDTSKGLSFLEAKYLVMLEYITSLGFVMHRKLEGGSIQGMPAVHSLIEQRTILEKIKPVEQKLKYQIDKLVRAAIIGQNPEAAAALRSSSSTTTPTLTVQQQRQLQEDGETTTSINAPSLAGAGGPLMTDPLAFRPNPKGLVAEAMEGGDQDDEQGAEGDGDDDEGKEGKVYRAPKMVPVHFEEDSSAVAKRLKYQARLQARAAKSRVMRDLVNELDDRPEEVSLDNDGVHYGMGLDDKQKERERYEEDNFTRTMLSKKELIRLRKGNMPRFENEFENLNDFAQMAPLQDDLESSELLRRNVMQRRKDRKVAAAAEMDRSDSDDDMGASRKRSRNTGGRDAFDGLMSDPRKRAKGRTAFDRSKRNLNRKKGRK